MDALVMCGGRGTRLDRDREKPLVRVGGRPMIDRVRSALAGSRIETIHAVVSPQTPATQTHLEGACNIIETHGDGYVTDLQAALEAVALPVLTAGADLPLLEPDLVNRIVTSGLATGGTLTTLVPVTQKRAVGASVDRSVVTDGRLPAGINVIGNDTTTDQYLSYDARLAVNVNRVGDITVAERLLQSDYITRDTLD